MKNCRLILLAISMLSLLAVGCDRPDSGEAPDAPFVVTPTELTFDAEGNSAEVTIEVGGSWQARVVEGADWIGIDRNSGEAGIHTLTVTAWRNTAEEAREGRVEISFKSEVKSVKVSQKGTKVTIAIPEATQKNTYVVDGVEHKFGSMGVMMVEDNVLVVATPESGVASAEKIFECQEYFYGAVTPLLLNKKFDVMTEQNLYTIVSTLSGALLEGVAPLYLEEVTAGECELTKEGNVLTLKTGLVLADGTQLAAYVEVVENVVVNENRLSRGDEEKPLRTSFYNVDAETTALYFTPAGIDYFEELEIASWYSYIVVDNSLVTGSRIDLANVGDRLFVFGIVDNVTGKEFAISNDDMRDAAGHFLLSSLGQERYMADIVLEIDGVAYTVAFSGKCISSDVKPEVKTNYITYKKREYDIVGAAIDTSAEVWVVELTVSNGNIITTTVPKDLFTGQATGFSRSPDLTVTYLDRTYSKANGDSGTIIASYDAVNSRLDLEFIGYGDLSFVYSGVCEQK